MTQPGKLNIFVVEDEPLLVMDLEFMIEDAGHHFLGDAASLNEVSANDLVDQADLFLVDIQLREGSTGLQVAKWLRENGDPLIVFVTANEDIANADGSPGDAMLPKPLYQHAFRDAVAYLAGGEQRGTPAGQVPPDLMVFDRLQERWDRKAAAIGSAL